MDKLTDRLPARQRVHVHGDFLANEESYWMVRDSLLSSHTGKWVAVQAGKVIAEADDVFGILDRVAVIGGHPYIARVGFEERAHSCRSLIQLVETPERILGQDVLNQLRVTFDGPASHVEID